MKKVLLWLLAVVALATTSCNKSVGYGDAVIRVSYTANDRPLVTGDLCYDNAAGNHFLITEIQWFISKVTLLDEEGNTYTLCHRDAGTTLLSAQDHIFYIDTNFPDSQTIDVAPLPTGHYTSMSFTFGLDKEDNRTGLFVDPPENNMFWPEPLGGGYHYMKLNGKYLDGNGDLAPLNIHLGMGQNETLTAFYDNSFSVTLPIDVTITEAESSVIVLDMNIDNWFQAPNTYDFNTDGSAIMQNQEAQQKLKENGTNVFSIKTTNDMESFTELGKELLRKAAPQPHFMRWENFKNTLESIKERL